MCKKCDKQLDNEHTFRNHMKEHLKIDNQIMNCHYCDFITNDETVYLIHIGDTHSPKFARGACGEEFTDMQKKIEHTMVAHAFVYSNQEKREEEYECFDCGQKVRNKQELMSHKKEKHYKKRLCSFFHGTMTTCRFPNKDCLNIHNENIWPTETAGDYRGRINCKHGNSCVFLTRPGGCFYKHAQSVVPHPNAWQ